MTETSALLIIVANPNPEAMDSVRRYVPAATELAAKYGARPMGRYQVMETLVGEAPAQVFGLTAFPSSNVLEEFFASPEYTTIAPLRDEGFSSLNAYVAELPGRPEPLPANGCLVATLGVPDPAGVEALALYGQASRDLALAKGGTPLARYPIRSQVFGDTPAAFLALASFPDEASPRSLFAAPQYAALVPSRNKAFSSVQAYLLGPN